MPTSIVIIFEILGLVITLSFIRIKYVSVSESTYKPKEELSVKKNGSDENTVLGSLT